MNISQKNSPQNTLRLKAEVLNFKAQRQAFLSIINEKQQEETLRASSLFLDKAKLALFSKEDALRIAFLASFELLG